MAEAAAQPTQTSRDHAAHVGSMTVEQLEKLIVGAISLAQAAGKTEGRASTPEALTEAARGAAGSVLEGIKSTERTVDRAAHAWQRQILWVDDRPDNNVYERNALESMGVEFTLALSTQQALENLSKNGLRQLFPTWEERRDRERVRAS